MYLPKFCEFRLWIGLYVNPTIWHHLTPSDTIWHPIPSPHMPRHHYTHSNWVLDEIRNSIFFQLCHSNVNSSRICSSYVFWFVIWLRDGLTWYFWYSPGRLLRTTTHFPSQARNEPSWGHNYSLNIPCSSTGFNRRYSPGVESHDCLHDTYSIPMLLHRFGVTSIFGTSLLDDLAPVVRLSQTAGFGKHVYYIRVYWDLSIDNNKDKV